MIEIPMWLLLVLLLIGGSILAWLVMLLITFFGLALLPKDAHDDLLNNDPKGKN